jgi:hypothetical protein
MGDVFEIDAGLAAEFYGTPNLQSAYFTRIDIFALLDAGVPDKFGRSFRSITAGNIHSMPILMFQEFVVTVYV